MIQSSTYALLSANAYWDIRELDRNVAPLPAGWTVLTQFDRSSSGANGTLFLDSGFSARVYKGPGDEIVIAYAGTEAGNTVTGMVNDFLSGNVPLAAGLKSEQAYQAALLYQEVKAWVGGPDKITFTGHSLGGGLAGLMGVWFNRPATVFAPAMFEHAASSLSLAASDVKWRLALASYSDAAFNSYLSLTDFAAREAQVTSYKVDGEVLDYGLPFIRTAGAAVVAAGVTTANPYLVTFGTLMSTVSFIEGGIPTRLLTGASWDSSYKGAKHSIDLHAAALLVPQFNVNAPKLADALPLLFDDKLYGYTVTGGTEQNLLVKLVRGEVGVRSDLGAITAPPNGMLTHFTADLGKLDAVGLAKLSQAGQQAVLAQGMEWYYWQDGTYAGGEFATTSGNLLQFTSAQGAGLLTGYSRAQPWVKTWLDAVYRDNGGSDYPSTRTSPRSATPAAVI